VRVLDDLRRLLPVAGLRRLLGVRMLSQSADGFFPVALTSYLFFSPERQTTPAAVAAATAATLLPFSLVGPLAGVLLDRWWRRDVLVFAPVARVVLAAAVAAVVVGASSRLAELGLFCLVVAGFAVNRFMLAALSAALPHTVDSADLLTANAVLPTAGTLAYTGGLALGALLQALLGGSDGATVVTLGVASALWLGATAVATRFGRRLLGPDGTNEARAGAGSELLAGVRHLRQRSPAGEAILLVGGQRLLAGVTLVAALLLYRGTYAARDDPVAGFAGFGLVVAAAGIGVVLAAAVVPSLAARSSVRKAVVVLLGVALVCQALFALTGAEPVLIATAGMLSLSGQALKIGVDTVVQQRVDDAHRGRVFAIYDLVFNGGLVAAATTAWLALPVSGDSPAVMAGVAVGLVALTALAARVLR
jgi:MFS family permease